MIPSRARGESGTRQFMNTQILIIFFSKRKRPLDPKEKENHSSDDKSRNYISFGRIYSRQSCPFYMVDSVVNFGIKYEASDDDDSDNEPKTLATQ